MSSFASVISFITVSVMIVVPVSPHCCPTIVGGGLQSCPISFFPGLFRCCSHAKCNIFCCNCGAKCMEYEVCEDLLKNEIGFNITEPPRVISNELICTSRERYCEIELEVNQSIEESLSLSLSVGVTLSAAILRKIRLAVSATLNNLLSVSTTTTTGQTFRCRIDPGTKGWLTIRPIFAAMNATYIRKCCEGKDCKVKEDVFVTYKQPFVNAEGFNSGQVFCMKANLTSAEDGGKGSAVESPAVLIRQ